MRPRPLAVVENASAARARARVLCSNHRPRHQGTDRVSYKFHHTVKHQQQQKHPTGKMRSGGVPKLKKPNIKALAVAGARTGAACFVAEVDAAARCRLRPLAVLLLAVAGCRRRHCGGSCHRHRRLDAVVTRTRYAAFLSLLWGFYLILFFLVAAHPTSPLNSGGVATRIVYTSNANTKIVM